MNESEQKKSKTIAQRVGAALLAITMGATPVAALSEENTNAQTVSGTTISAVLTQPMDITRYEKSFDEFYMSSEVDPFYNKLSEITDPKVDNTINYWQYIDAFSCVYYANATVNDEEVYKQQNDEAKIFFTPEEILGIMTVLDPSYENLIRIYDYGNIISTTKCIEASKSFCEKLYTFSKYSKIPFPFNFITEETEVKIEHFKITNNLSYDDIEDQYNLMCNALKTVNMLKEVGSLIAEINIGREDGTPDIECSDKLLAKIYELYVEDENKMPTLGYGAQIMCNAMIKAFVDTATEEELTLHQDMGNAPKGMCIKVDGEDIMTVVNGEEVRISSADDKAIKYYVHINNTYAYETEEGNVLHLLLSKIQKCGCNGLTKEYSSEMNDENLMVVLTDIADDNFTPSKDTTPEEIADLKDTATKVFDILNTESPYYTVLVEEMNKLFEVSEKIKEETPIAQLTEAPKIAIANSKELEGMKLTVANSVSNDGPTMRKSM